MTQQVKAIEPFPRAADDHAVGPVLDRGIDVVVECEQASRSSGVRQVTATCQVP